MDNDNSLEQQKQDMNTSKTLEQGIKQYEYKNGKMANVTS
jgi:hypothetical protein